MSPERIIFQIWKLAKKGKGVLPSDEQPYSFSFELIPEIFSFDLKKNCSQLKCIQTEIFYTRREKIEGMFFNGTTIITFVNPFNRRPLIWIFPKISLKAGGEKKEGRQRHADTAVVRDPVMGGERKLVP